MATVLGIFPDLASVSKLIETLGNSGLDVSRAHVLCTDDVPTEITESGVKCTWLGDVQRAIGQGGSIITNSGGVDIPGLSHVSAGDGVVYGEAINDYLADFNVPDGRTDDYAVAVEAGRAIAGYSADDGTVDKLRGVFSSAGATVVDVF